MNIDFVINDYLIAWYMLFKPSYNEEVQKVKEKLWTNHQVIYKRMQKENIEILKYTNDFIPDDDTLYNLVFETNTFKEAKRETEKFKQELLETWDKNKKKINKEYKDIVRFKEEKNYTVLLVSPKLDIIEVIKSNPKKNIAWGKYSDDLLKTLILIIYVLLKYEIGDINSSAEITSSILELAINNELYTRLSNSTKYGEGSKRLKLLRKQLYPYFLMYLGCDKEEMVSYMMRDGIAFDIDKYLIEKALKNIDLCNFIDFCSKNQKYIIKLDELNK
ncbi:MAG: hypothetical protein PUD59_00355 [bacterium]|nr:hypothetical protein [bacterium]